MTAVVVKGGSQTLIQAGPRTGQRHFGVPAAGAADCLSLALANRLVGNAAFLPALEAVLLGPTLKFESATHIALVGGVANAKINGEPVKFHQTIAVVAGDELVIGPVSKGARVYLAFAGGLVADDMLGSVSTYLPARLGGLAGRAVRAGDRLRSAARPGVRPLLTTPPEFQPPMPASRAIRACLSAESHWLDDALAGSLFDRNWTISQRADRMGLELRGKPLAIGSHASMPSVPVFPGTLQCPPSGVPLLLGVDAQTTGGYPRLLQVARADLHLIGQLRPGDSLRFLRREPDEAIAELHAKHNYWRTWLPDIEQVI
ncbi:MAG TPA: biotin-dependent carboxyltransferase family protein [Woeseiaceae bacterium]|nr:biotin-dependent carboxyltransferase family protein [Woeseiaceae bacterium]